MAKAFKITKMDGCQITDLQLHCTDAMENNQVLYQKLIEDQE